MRLRVMLVPLLLVLAGFFLLARLQWKHQLGGLASSPQEIDIELGTGKIVGGGKAVIRFRRYVDEIATLVVRCRGVREVLEIESQDTIEDLCGISARLQLVVPGSDASDPPVAWLKVSWES